MNNMPSRVSLAMLPTPLVFAARTSAKIGAKVWIKRDDLTGSVESGNKIRKLEFLVADALSKNADVLISCGGEQSNHCRAVAAVARRLGMDVHLVLRRTGEGPTGNWLLDLIFGATFRWVTAEEYERHDEIMLEEAEKLKKTGKNPYIIPEGGSNALGVWGYFNAAQEIIAQSKEQEFIPDYVIVPSGSGATYTGLWLGFKHLGVDTKVIGITAGPETTKQKENIIRVSREFVERYEMDIDINPDEITLFDNFWGEGYGVMDEDLARFIADFARTEGVVLDNAYTGKAFRAAFSLIEQNEIPKDADIILCHTGGIFGIFAKGQYFRELYFSGARTK